MLVERGLLTRIPDVGVMLVLSLIDHLRLSLAELLAEHH
jgi:hypothetical protein